MRLPARFRDILIPWNNPGLGFGFGGAMILLVLTAAESVYPGFSTHSDAISALGGTGVATEFYWNSALLAASLLWIWSSAGLFHSKKRSLIQLPYYLTGIGMALVALSPWDARPVTHTIGAISTLLFGIASCYLGGRMASGPMRYLSYLAATFSLLAFLSGFLGLFTVLGPGGLERMDYYPILLWETAFGGYLLGESHGRRKSRGGDADGAAEASTSAVHTR